VLDNIRLERLANDKHYNSLVQFVSYEEKNTVNAAPGATALHFLCNLQIEPLI
jgi:hypothetical protein